MSLCVCVGRGGTLCDRVTVSVSVPVLVSASLCLFASVSVCVSAPQDSAHHLLTVPSYQIYTCRTLPPTFPWKWPGTYAKRG